MPNQNKKPSLYLYALPAIIISAFLALSLVFAWTEPSKAPPEGNVSAPINVGGESQIKSGPLQVNGFRNIGTTVLDGKVGIGTTTPVGKLDVFGGMLYVRAASGPAVGAEQIRIGRWDNDIRYHSIYSSHSAVDDTNYLQFRVHDKGGIPYTGQVTVMTLLGTGNVGIGTTTPGEKLQVAGNLNMSGGENAIINVKQIRGRTQDRLLRLDVGPANPLTLGNLYINYDTPAAVTFFGGAGTGSDVRMRITSAGSVGIGDATPASLFTVGSGDLFQVNSSGDLIKIRNVTYSWPSAQGGANTFLQNAGNGTLSWATITGALPSGTSGQTLRHDGASWVANSNIFNNGTNVGIGTISPGAKLEVAGQIKITGGTPGLNKVLTSDASGLASWQTAAGGVGTGIYVGSCSTGSWISWVEGRCPSDDLRIGMCEEKNFSPFFGRARWYYKYVGCKCRAGETIMFLTALREADERRNGGCEVKNQNSADVWGWHNDGTDCAFACLGQ